MRNSGAEALSHSLKWPAFKRHLSSTEIARHKTKGLTLVELLVSLILISFAIIAASSLISYGIFGLRKTENNYDTQNLVDRNLSMIESMADRYACVGGTCTVQSSVPAKDEYVDPSDTSDWDDFKNRCDATQLTTPPSDLISPLATYITTNLPQPAGLHRDLKVHGSGSDTGIGRIRHMTIQYRLGSPDGPMIRNSTIIPTITSYCP
jgi:type II secretory pathway pseudopilin PulG